jgi:hypothetical protein
MGSGLRPCTPQRVALRGPASAGPGTTAERLSRLGTLRPRSVAAARSSGAAGTPPHPPGGVLSLEHDLFRPAYARRSITPFNCAKAGLRAGGKPVSTFRDQVQIISSASNLRMRVRCQEVRAGKLRGRIWRLLRPLRSARLRQQTPPRRSKGHELYGPNHPRARPHGSPIAKARMVERPAHYPMLITLHRMAARHGTIVRQQLGAAS